MLLEASLSAATAIVAAASAGASTSSMTGVSGVVGSTPSPFGSAVGGTPAALADVPDFGWRRRRVVGLGRPVGSSGIGPPSPFPLGRRGV